MNAYDLQKNSRRCQVTGRELNVGETCMSALVETYTGIERRDFSMDAWKGPPEGTIGYWKNVIPSPTAKKKTGTPRTVGHLLELFDRLEDKTDERSIAMRYMLALMLVQKKAFKMAANPAGNASSGLMLTRPAGDKASEAKTFEVALGAVTTENASYWEEELERELRGEPTLLESAKETPHAVV